MESYIQISKLNDFVFCPKSLYLHSIYDGFSVKTYHQTPQIVGKIKHENIEQGKYSTSKNLMQGIAVYSDKYGLAGKIDIYDRDKKTLIERKNKIKKIFNGYKYQLYAQYFCLKDMGHHVKKMFLHSLSDNKRYEVALPNKKEIKNFETIIENIKKFNILEYQQTRACKNKCDNCIYSPLC